MKAIISLNNLPFGKFKEFESFDFLKEYKNILDYHPCVDGYFNPDKTTKEVAVLEPYIAWQYLKELNYDIEIHYDKSYFIFNDSLFAIDEFGIKEIDLNNLLWFSFREIWSHPFYRILDILLSKHNGLLHKPNKQTMQNVGCMNKFYSIISLYHFRDKFIGDIVIPYNIARKYYKAFLDFMDIGDTIVLKQDCIQEGAGVSIKNKNDEFVYMILDNHKSKDRELFIMPLIDIASEYRVYFTNYKEIKIFSIKKRINTTPISELLSKDNLKIYQNIDVTWELIDKDSQEFIRNIAFELLQILPYNFGALEFAITKDNKIRFFEVNQMAGILLFENESKDIIDWYREVLRVATS